MGRNDSDDTAQFWSARVLGRHHLVCATACWEYRGSQSAPKSVYSGAAWGRGRAKMGLLQVGNAKQTTALQSVQQSAEDSYCSEHKHNHLPVPPEPWSSRGVGFPDSVFGHINDVAFQKSFPSKTYYGINTPTLPQQNTYLPDHF